MILFYIINVKRANMFKSLRFYGSTRLPLIAKRNAGTQLGQAVINRMLTHRYAFCVSRPVALWQTPNAKLIEPNTSNEKPVQLKTSVEPLLYLFVTSQ